MPHVNVLRSFLFCFRYHIFHTNFILTDHILMSIYELFLSFREEKHPHVKLCSYGEVLMFYKICHWGDALQA